MGHDASGTISESPIPDTVIVRPNTYELGRANIIIYAPTAPTSINVDLSTTGLRNGQTYTIKNAFNYNGPNVLIGTYDASSPSVAVPLTGAATTVARPVGMNNTPETTSPHFFVLLIKGS